MAGLPPPPVGGHGGPPGHYAYGTYAPTGAGRGRGSPLVVLWAVMFGLGNALGLAGWATFPDEDDLSVFADLEEYVSDATLADRMVAAGFVVSAAAAVVAAVMVRTLSRRQSERVVAVTAAAAAHAPYAAPAPPPPTTWALTPPNVWGPPPS